MNWKQHWRQPQRNCEQSWTSIRHDTKITPARYPRTLHMKLLRTLFVVALLIYAGMSRAEELAGYVINVTDGNTITVVNVKGQQLRVRLAAVAAPERGQQFFKHSTDHLTKLVRRKHVIIQWHGKDRYGRLIGVVTLNGRDINLEQVRAGCAWWMRESAEEQSARDRSAYERAERYAQVQRLGLWADTSPIPPWDWHRPK